MCNFAFANKFCYSVYCLLFSDWVFMCEKLKICMVAVVNRSWFSKICSPLDLGTLPGNLISYFGILLYINARQFT